MANYADTSRYNQEEITLWGEMKAHEGQVFETVNGHRYRYIIRGNEIFVDRKDKSITRATVNLAYSRAAALEGKVSGPKALGVFGASYLYPIFIE